MIDEFKYRVFVLNFLLNKTGVKKSKEVRMEILRNLEYHYAIILTYR